MSVDSFTQWIEGHPATVDVLKWAALLLIAWGTGAFTYLRNLTRKPRVRVSEVTSRCFLESYDEFEGLRDAERASLLLDIQVSNRSSSEIVVWTFDMQIRRRLRFRPWGPRISAVSLPNRVRHTMGSGVKIMRNWFARFPDEQQDLTISGHLSPGHADSGYALFVSFTHGSWNPVVTSDEVVVRLTVGLTTGKKIVTKARIHTTRDADFFESLVPGVLEQVRHPTAWNLPLRHS